MNSTSNILMIRPSQFACNDETALNNSYQNSDASQSSTYIRDKAIIEFDNFVDLLMDSNINVLVFDDCENTYTPDSLFPNNWITTHDNGLICLYPMFAKNRRIERRDDIINFLKSNFIVSDVVSKYVFFEENNNFLEGTGSMVLDRFNKIAYAAISSRTNKKLFNSWCKDFNYTAVCFETTLNINGRIQPVYHTNVLMSVCTNMVFICLDVLTHDHQKEELLTFFDQTNKEVIKISIEQKKCFVGNVIEIKNKNEETYIVMSTRAFNALDVTQIQIINKYAKILHSPLDTIEHFGGGGARCMIAEVFLKN